MFRVFRASGSEGSGCLGILGFRALGVYIGFFKDVRV